MRVKLSVQERDKLFNRLKKKLVNWRRVAACQGISVRTLTDWRKGKYSLSLNAYLQFIKLSGLRKEDFHPQFLADYWNIKDAARKGAHERMKRYGNVGTVEGRRLGGLRSVLVHKKNPSAFKIAKVIKRPKKSSKLAEIMGIIIGDGHLSEWQIVVSTNAMTDRNYAVFVQNCFKELFGISSFWRERNDDNTVSVVVSSKRLVKLIHCLGMPIGNKLKKGLAIPYWIFQKDIYKKAFIRGLFDTDGCIYIDKHRINGKKYMHYGWVITSASKMLIKDIINILEDLNFHPTNKESQKSVYLRRQNEIKRYFQEVNTHNLKHKMRYNNGRVPKWS
ncbi:MAG: hypothetical protein M1429_01535 [Patescibacteria group bacterium]|nr:hypothetical protein [Patescibacteria group bacterium]